MEAPAPGGGAASPALVINSEVKAVLAVMRRNVRWGGRYGLAADDPQLDHPLVRSLKSLRRQVFDWSSEGGASASGSRRPWSSVDPTSYLRPFLDVVRSEEAGAPITGAALSSVQRILLEVLYKAGSGPRLAAAMRLVVEAVTGCRFEVTDPASEEAVLMKILQVLLACMKSQAAAAVLGDQDVCSIVNACFRIVHQAGTKGELLQRVARQTMHELVRCIFAHLKDVEDFSESTFGISEMSAVDKNQSFGIVQGEDEDGSVGTVAPGARDYNSAAVKASDEANIFVEPYGVPCMVEIFHFLCSLLNIVDQVDISRTINQIAYDEDVPLFALSMLSSAIELGGASARKHPKLLSLIQVELFQNLMQFGLSMSPLILSMVCNIVLNLYHYLRTDLKLQMEAFLSSVLLRLAQSRYGASYHPQEVAMEAIVDFCRQKTFMNEMYANFDCEIACSNVFEELVNLLSKSAFPVNCPLSSLHLLALDGLIAVVRAITEKIVNEPHPEPTLSELGEYTPFWTLKCDNYSDPSYWAKFVQLKKSIKRKLMIGVNHFNKDPKKGLEYLQGAFLLPENLDPQSVACFFRYTSGLDKNVVGDFLGNHDTFSVQVLQEFARMFDFQGMNMDTALRLFLDTFRLPGESQKIHRVLEAFAERYFEQSPHILADKDSALVLAYSLIMLNTDQHNSQVKKKMTEEDFIRNNRRINGGNDLPREFLSELYHSICRNEIRIIPGLVSGFKEMSSSRWIDLMQKSKNVSPYILCDSRPILDRYMFVIMSDPTIAAISVVFDNAEHEEVFLTCIDGFVNVAKISAYYHLVDVLDNIVVFLCKFTALLDSSLVEEPVTAFGDDMRARLATETVFNIANSYGDFIRTAWRSILDCIIRLHKLDLLPASFTGDAADDPDLPGHDKLVPSSLATSTMQKIETQPRSFGLMGRFSQLLSFDTEEPRSQPTEEELAAQQRTLQTIEKCHIGSIITESKFLHADSLMQLARALVLAAGRSQKAISSDDEDTGVFCLELLIAITLNNRDRIKLLWPVINEHIADIIQTMVMPCDLVEKTVFGLLKICQRLLPYKENLADDLLKSLQLVLKLDARVADAYCESITQEVTRLLKSNATHIKSKMGWQTIISLLSITARHPEASEIGFEALEFIMSEGAHLSPVNYILCIQASRHFAESKVGPIDRSVLALDLMVESANCLASWSQETKDVGEEAESVSKGIGEMWLRLVEALKMVCLDQRDGVRNHAMLSLQSCLIGTEGVTLSMSFWLQAFDPVLFAMLDDLLDIALNHSQKVYRNLETTLLHAMKLLTKVYLHSLQDLVGLSSFMELWQGILGRMEKYMQFKVKRSDKLQELIPELLKNTLLVMKTKGILTVSSGGLWDLTWPYVNTVAPSLQSEVFPGWEEQLHSAIQPVGVSSVPLATALQTSLEV